MESIMSIKDAYISGIKRAFDDTPFAKWLKAEGAAIHEGFTVKDVRELELAPWPRIGGKAVFITLYSLMEAGNGLYLAEIPPGGSLEPERWCCQKIMFVEQDLLAAPPLGLEAAAGWDLGEIQAVARLHQRVERDKHGLAADAWPGRQLQLAHVLDGEALVDRGALGLQPLRKGRVVEGSLDARDVGVLD